MRRRHKKSNRKYGKPETKVQPDISIREHTGEVALSPRMTCFVSTVIRGLYTDGHMFTDKNASGEQSIKSSTEQSMGLIGLAHNTEASRKIGVVLPVDEYDRIVGLTDALLKSYEDRKNFIKSWLGGISTTGSAASEFKAACTTLSEASLDNARARAAEIAEREDVISAPAAIVLDEYVAGYQRDVV